MDEYHISRAHLESLTTGELASLAENQGVDIPPGLERSFIIEELLETFSEDDFSSGEEDAVLEEKELLEPVPLPRQYNITHIDVIIRDPRWVYAFWEIRGSDKESFERERDFEGYYLKVSSLDKSGEENSFVVSVGTSDNAWYLGFSPESIAGNTLKTNTAHGRFRVELCVRFGETSGSAQGIIHEVLAVSRPFGLPSLLGVQGISGELNQLCRLSGLEELPILRNEERSLRSIRWSENRNQN
jgi:hypothetical protein